MDVRGLCLTTCEVQDSERFAFAGDGVPSVPALVYQEHGIGLVTTFQDAATVLEVMRCQVFNVVIAGACFAYHKPHLDQFVLALVLWVVVTLSQTP